MTTTLTRYALAAALTVSVLASGTARAHDGDHDRRPPQALYPPPAYPAPAPAGYGPGYGREGSWRHDGWRERERARLRFELARLERTRDDFYARGEWRPGKVRKFERWYAVQRADLERQLSALRWYAGR